MNRSASRRFAMSVRASSGEEHVASCASSRPRSRALASSARQLARDREHDRRLARLVHAERARVLPAVTGVDHDPTHAALVRSPRHRAPTRVGRGLGRAGRLATTGTAPRSVEKLGAAVAPSSSSTTRAVRSVFWPLRTTRSVDAPSDPRAVATSGLDPDVVDVDVQPRRPPRASSTLIARTPAESSITTRVCVGCSRSRSRARDRVPRDASRRRRAAARTARPAGL